MKIKSITYAGRTWHFKEGQKLTLKPTATLEVEGSFFGRTECSIMNDDVISKLESGFAADYDHIAMESDDNLTGDAIDLKNRILDAVERVETV